MQQRFSPSKKRLFISLLILSYFVMFAVSYGMWRIGYLGLAEIHHQLPVILGWLGMIFFAAAGLGIFSVILAVWQINICGSLQPYVYGMINTFFPLIVMLGKVFRISRRDIEKSFIVLSNQLIHQRNLKVPADRLLVVTPHCLQLATCPHKITRDPHNCKRCGGCDIGALVNLADEMGFHFFVVTGGTLARQTVKKIRPKAVLAIACERDLTSGIQDVYPLPAVGVMNLRPNGPCYNTHVDVELVRREVERFLLPAKEGAE